VRIGADSVLSPTEMADTHSPTLIRDVVTRTRTRPLRHLGLQLLLLEGGVLAVVLIVLNKVGSEAAEVHSALRLVVGVATGIFAAGGLIEAFAAVRAPALPPVPDQPLPRTTAIIPAYLPNEESIVLDTIAKHLRNGPQNHEVIVAYNTPIPMAIESELDMLAMREPRLVVLNVGGSRSKAENINAAVQVATGDVIGIFDCDHHPEPQSYERAWRWLANEADVVQGRCAVRRSKNTFLSALVAAEFEQMYTVGHPGRARAFGFGLFGGSNGYWRAAALKAVPFDPSALTEDIDASVRLLRIGGRIVADPGIVSTELSPPSLRALCYQRLRWAQGWFQIARRHVAPVWSDDRVPLRQRFGVAWIFGAGALTAWIAALLLPLTIEAWISPLTASLPTRIFFTIGSFAFLFQAGVAYRHALPPTRRPAVFGAYVLATIVFYGYLRVALVRLAHIHEFAGRSEWRVTPRAREARRAA
jgi:cellulose synthase/poly-beta-1,6-N-acetylglucosamine synthase-like glycosyltransferase